MKFEIEIESKISRHEVELRLAKTLQIWKKYDSIEYCNILLSLKNTNTVISICKNKFLSFFDDIFLI